MKVLVEVNTEKCDLCGLCVDYCPAFVFSIRDQLVVADSSKCIECYGCVPLCPREAICVKLEGDKRALSVFTEKPQ
ncbi:MAG: indolepyruvate ferredoxin oxidoreductase subunit alpha [Desulfurococcaceae archaeon]